jgi:hypothetical protein
MGGQPQKEHPAGHLDRVWPDTDPVEVSSSRDGWLGANLDLAIVGPSDLP